MVAGPGSASAEEVGPPCGGEVGSAEAAEVAPPDGGEVVAAGAAEVGVAAARAGLTVVSDTAGDGFRGRAARAPRECFPRERVP